MARSFVLNRFKYFLPRCSFGSRAQCCGSHAVWHSREFLWLYGPLCYSVFKRLWGIVDAAVKMLAACQNISYYILFVNFCNLDFPSSFIIFNFMNFRSGEPKPRLIPWTQSLTRSLKYFSSSKRVNSCRMHRINFTESLANWVKLTISAALFLHIVIPRWWGVNADVRAMGPRQDEQGW